MSEDRLQEDLWQEVQAMLEHPVMDPNPEKRAIIEEYLRRDPRLWPGFISSAKRLVAEESGHEEETG